MQDWSMIPLHIRCTRRKDIDPNYHGDDAKWWKTEEKKGFAMFWDGGTPSGQSEDQQRLLAFLRERGGANTLEINKHLGWNESKTSSAILGLSLHYPVFEEPETTTHRCTYYGLLV